MNQEFSSILYSALCACFALLPNSQDASTLIREAYQEPENAPRPPRGTDVIYFSVEPDATVQEAPPEYSSDDPAFGTHTVTVSSYSAWRLLVICYGMQLLSLLRLYGFAKYIR